jgi:hypothetical protein
MKRAAVLLSLGFLASVVATTHARAQAPAISEADARSIATEAYLYFYPLVKSFSIDQMVENLQRSFERVGSK